MENHSCKTYFAVQLEFDREKNIALLHERRDCTPEEIGIFNKDEVEKFIVGNLGVTPKWKRHSFIIGYNEEYDADVNVMIRETIKDLQGKEEKLKRLKERFGAELTLKIVPYISSQSKETPQSLSPDKDIVDFLYNSETSLDIDYYIV